MRIARGPQRFVEVPQVATTRATGQRKAARRALTRTSHPGVYRRGRSYVAVYRREGRQRKETVGSFAEARQIKVARQAESLAERMGPTLRDHALRWVDSHAGLGHDTVGERTRREYRRLLTTFAFRYFPPETRLGDLDREALQGFVTWLAAYRGERGRLSDRSIANVVGAIADVPRRG
jgi:aryl-alcohol dehydrogenase-like predicted oxidoreductase